MKFRQVAIIAAVVALCLSGGVAQAQDVERPLLPYEVQPGPERLGTNSFGALTPTPGAHSEQLPAPDLDLVQVPSGPRRYYVTIRYYSCNPWFIHPYTGVRLTAAQLVRSVQTTNPDWPGRGMPIEELLKPDPETGEPLVQVEGLIDPASGEEMVIDENNPMAMQEWEDEQTAEQENVEEARRVAQVPGLVFPEIKPSPIWHSPVYGLYCLKVRICIPIFTHTPGSVWQYWVRFPYFHQPYCWSRWWWHRWRLINGVWRIYPWRPLCVPLGGWLRVGPNWIWQVTNVNAWRYWCVYGLRYYFTPFRVSPLPKIALLNDAVPLPSSAKWLRVWPYPRVRYWPFRPYCTRWYWFRCVPWFTYRYFPPVIQAAFAIPNAANGSGFAPAPDDDPAKPSFPLDPPKVADAKFDQGRGDSFFDITFDIAGLCTVRPLESRLGDEDGDGMTTRADVPRNVQTERFDDPNPDTEDDDGKVGEPQ